MTSNNVLLFSVDLLCRAREFAGFPQPKTRGASAKLEEHESEASLTSTTKVCRIWVSHFIVGGTILSSLFKQRRVAKKLELIKRKIPFGIQGGIFTILQ